MAIWPFNRNKTDSTDLPQEVQDYYQSEKRQRAGVAGLLAVGTLIVTVLLALGIFFGGRWAYRAIFDNDNNTTQTETNDVNNKPAEQPAPESNQGAAPSTQTTTPAPAPTTLPSDGETSTSAPANGKTTSEIPNTGPGDVTAVFIGTVIVASVVHYLITTKRQLTN